MDEEAGYKWLRGVIRGEMARQQITYKELLERLNRIGVEDTENNLRNKIGRGKFSAMLFMQCLEVLGVDHIRISMLEDTGFGHEKPMKRLARKWGPPSEALGEIIEEEVEEMDKRDRKSKT
ncbi:hypothetical protein E5163_09045 [Marinicauda algicola]|uniref:DUF6471 domain-containing protein n=1 Tax=Marinicauda algicola TaxID=2029849 RepID=A0A4S2H1C5_9PROT|nr:DUF6471 domain-containing protein [Marinicauda algicola]TGY89254.1 hypothetical protein E5163_09045 [Marinicauda algicola]